MFTSLSLQNWKNFKEVSAHLTSRVFLIGPNASGKSNLLDAFRFLYDISKVGGGFQYAVNQRGGVSKIRCLAARTKSDIVFDVTLKLGETDWRYRFAFGQKNIGQTSLYPGQPNVPILLEEKIWRNGEMILDRPSEEDRNDPFRMTQTALEQINANKDFREIADYFSTIRYMHVVPQLIREPDRSVGRTNDPYGGDFLDQLARTPVKTRDSRLQRIQEALKIIVPQLTELKFEMDARTGVPHLKGRYEHWRPKAGWQSEEQFSDGTLRLIGLLWSLQDGRGPLLLEEPELSLHSEVVRYLPQVMLKVMRKSQRQIIVSTHSRELFDEGIVPEEMLVLEPSSEGTQILEGDREPAMVAIAEAGGSAADIAFAKTNPLKSNKQMDLLELL
jgi:predicted ATPase